MNHAAHFVQFFAADARLILEVTRFLAEGLEAGATCMVLGTSEHRAAFAAELRSRGLDPVAMEAEYRYISLDVAEVLAKLMRDGRPDRQRFHEVLGQLIMQAAARGQPVRVFGEMATLPASEGQRDALIRIEELWNELSRHHSFTLFCAYPLAAFAGDPHSRELICATHGHVVPSA